MCKGDCKGIVLHEGTLACAWDKGTLSDGAGSVACDHPFTCCARVTAPSLSQLSQPHHIPPPGWKSIVSAEHHQLARRQDAGCPEAYTPTEFRPPTALTAPYQLGSVADPFLACAADCDAEPLCTTFSVASLSSLVFCSLYEGAVEPIDPAGCNYQCCARTPSTPPIPPPTESPSCGGDQQHRD